MPVLPVLDIAIGLSFIYLLLALWAQRGVERRYDAALVFFRRPPMSRGN
jgi:hypothetical protein